MCTRRVEEVRHGQQKELYTIDQACSFSQEELVQNHRDYVNSNLVSMMSLIGFDKKFVRAQGMHVWDEEGNEYLDFLGSYGALNLGHNPPLIMQAVAKAGEVAQHASGSPKSVGWSAGSQFKPNCTRWFKTLVFGNCGTEAVEGA